MCWLTIIFIHVHYPSRQQLVAIHFEGGLTVTPTSIPSSSPTGVLIHHFSQAHLSVADRGWIQPPVLSPRVEGGLSLLTMEPTLHV